MRKNSECIDEIVRFDPWYLVPPPQVDKVQHEESYIKNGEKQQGRRKIYENVGQYDDFQMEQISKFKDYLESQKFEASKDLKDSDYLKILYSGQFDMKKSFKILHDHLIWKNDLNQHILDEHSLQILQNGVVYLLGRDRDFRPIIYLDATKLNIQTMGDNLIRALCVFLDMIKKYMFVDGVVENWIIVIETAEIGLLNFPFQALGRIIGQMQFNYAGCLQKLFLLNPSFGLNTSWSIICGFIDEETQSKIQFIQQKNHTQLFDFIDIKYVEKQFGGEFDNLVDYWPPVNIYLDKIQQKEPNNIITASINASENNNDSLQDDQKSNVAEFNNENEINQQNIYKGFPSFDADEKTPISIKKAEFQIVVTAPLDDQIKSMYAYNHFTEESVEINLQSEKQQNEEQDEENQDSNQIQMKSQKYQSYTEGQDDEISDSNQNQQRINCQPDVDYQTHSGTQCKGWCNTGSQTCTIF